MSRLRFLLGLSAISLLAGQTAARAALAPIDRVINGTHYSVIDYTYVDGRSNASGNWNINGRLYVPDNLNPNVAHPLVMFLHGAGENGTDNIQQVNGNMDNLLVNARANGFLVYIPQAPNDYWSPDQLFMSQNMIAKSVNDYKVDPNRLYATGLSMGGAGVNLVLGSFASEYAAYVPLSMAASMTTDQVAAGAGKPIWVFHGRQDATIAVSMSQNTVKNLAAASGLPAPVFPSSSSPVDYHYDQGNLHYTEYAAGGHDNVVWNNGAYNTPTMYQWMLQQHTSNLTLQQGHSIAMNFLVISGATTADSVSTDTSGNRWNTVGRYGSEKSTEIAVGFARDNTGASTTMSIGLTKAFANRNNTVPTGITALADPSMAGEWWQTAKGGSAEITFYNLAPNGVYTLTLFSSTTNSTANTVFTVGSTTATLNATNNLSNIALLPNLVPTAGGTLTLTVAALNSSNWGYLNALTITAVVPEPVSIGWIVFTLPLLSRKRRSTQAADVLPSFN